MMDILDVCCGSRMFWFDKQNPNTVFCDKRVEHHSLTDSSTKSSHRDLVISPTVQTDFTALPFPSNHFKMVVFDPPHFKSNGAKSWLNLKYGTLTDNWPDILKQGFAECFRVLIPDGVLIFKWCADEIPVSKILALTAEKPIIGHISGKRSSTHWITFMKRRTF